MGYRVDKNLNKKGIRNKKLRNKKLRNRSLLAAIVFTLSIISNSIVPKTLLVTATENNKFNIDNVIVEEKVNSDDGIFEIAREAEKVSESEIKVSVNLKINKDNIPVANNNIATQYIQEITENEVDTIDESQEEIQNEAVDKKEESVDIKKSISNAIITESLIEGFDIVNDSIKLEEVKEEVNVDLTESLRNSEYTDLSMESLGNKLDIELKNISYSEIKLSYSININSNIKALDDVALFSESLLKYNLVENDEDKIVNIPNAVVSVKELVVDEAVENNVDKNQDEVSDYIDETQEDEESATLDNSNVIPETVTYDLLPLADNPDSIDFPVTIRDFNADSILFRPPFKDPYKGGPGMVSTTLGTDKKPIFLGGDKYNMDFIADAIVNNKMFSKEGTYADAKAWYENLTEKNNYNKVKDEIDTAYKYLYYHFNNLFNDVSGLNMQDNSVIKNLKLNKNSGIYTFDSDNEEPYKRLGGFFPLDDKGFNESIDGKGGKHNFHFTLESHSRFWVGNNDNLEFNFIGDDDVWVYVNGQLVIDIGGIHEAQKASFTIKNGRITTSDNRTIELGTEKWVDFDFFYIERNPIYSNLKIQTNIKFEPSVSVEKKAYKIFGNEETLIEDDGIVNIGDRIFYKFIISNYGNIDLTNVEVVDENPNQGISIKVDKEGVYTKNNEANWIRLDQHDIEIYKNGNLSDISTLSEMKIGDVIEIKSSSQVSSSLLSYLIPNDILKEKNSEEISNTVNVSGTASLNGKTATVSGEDTININVVKAPEIHDNKLTVTKTVRSITRNRNGNDENVDFNITNKLVSEKILPGDIVEFEIIVENGCYRIDYDINGNASKSGIAVGGLTLNDQLSIGNDKEYIQLKYGSLDSDAPTISSDTTFDLDKPTISGNTVTSSKKTFYYKWTVKEDEANHYRNIVNNAVTLYKGGIQLGYDEVNLNILSPSLRIKKVVDLNKFTDSKTNRTFTIMVKGSDGSQYNIEAEAGTVYTLYNLKYGVTYTVSEIVPMNYKLVSISGGTKSSIKDDLIKDQITLTGYNNELITVTNKKVNDSFWTSENKVINVFKNFIDNIIGGVE